MVAQKARAGPTLVGAGTPRARVFRDPRVPFGTAEKSFGRRRRGLFALGSNTMIRQLFVRYSIHSGHDGACHVDPQAADRRRQRRTKLRLDGDLVDDASMDPGRADRRQPAHAGGRHDGEQPCGVASLPTCGRNGPPAFNRDDAAGRCGQFLSEIMKNVAGIEKGPRSRFYDPV